MRKIKPPPADAEEAAAAPTGVLTRRDFRAWAFRTLGVQENELPESWAKEKQLGESADH